MKKSSSQNVFFAKGLLNDDGRAGRGTVFQEVRPGADLKTGDFVEKSWGGYRSKTLLYFGHGVVHWVSR